jgi:hypothetical protein
MLLFSFHIHEEIHCLSQQALGRLCTKENDVNCLPFSSAVSADRCLAVLKTLDFKGISEIVRFYPLNGLRMKPTIGRLSTPSLSCTPDATMLAPPLPSALL